MSVGVMFNVLLMGTEHCAHPVKTEPVSPWEGRVRTTWSPAQKLPAQSESVNLQWELAHHFQSSEGDYRVYSAFWKGVCSTSP